MKKVIVQTIKILPITKRTFSAIVLLLSVSGASAATIELDPFQSNIGVDLFIRSGIQFPAVPPSAVPRPKPKLYINPHTPDPKVVTDSGTIRHPPTNAMADGYAELGLAAWTTGGGELRRITAKGNVTSNIRGMDEGSDAEPDVDGRQVFGDTYADSFATAVIHFDLAYPTNFLLAVLLDEINASVSTMPLIGASNPSGNHDATTTAFVKLGTDLNPSRFAVLEAKVGGIDQNASDNVAHRTIPIRLPSGQFRFEVGTSAMSLLNHGEGIKGATRANFSTTLVRATTIPEPPKLSLIAVALLLALGLRAIGERGRSC